MNSLPPEKRLCFGRFLLREKYKFVDKNSIRRKSVKDSNQQQEGTTTRA
jgi:hypothetical protein